MLKKYFVLGSPSKYKESGPDIELLSLEDEKCCVGLLHGVRGMAIYTVVAEVELRQIPEGESWIVVTYS
jgi:hypothetical protein